MEAATTRPLAGRAEMVIFDRDLPTYHRAHPSVLGKKLMDRSLCGQRFYSTHGSDRLINHTRGNAEQRRMKPCRRCFR